LHTRAVTVLESRIYGGEAPQRVAALPDAFNPFYWRGLIETPGFYSVHEFNLLRDFDSGNKLVFYKPPPTAALQRARQAPAIRDFLRFAQYPLWSEEPVSSLEGGVRVQVADLRFGTPPRPRFVATAIVDAKGQVVSSWFHFDPVRASGSGR
jgi:hypothetical protein